MDNLTHTLTGIALAQAGLKRKSRFSMLALIIASNLPDIDVVAAPHGGIAYLKYHRGITHSLIGLTVLAAILAIIIYVVGRRASPAKDAPPISLKWLFLVCWIGTACHVLMDFTNAYGIRPFLPFSGRWFALDLMPIVGPWLLLILILGLCVPVLLRMVTEEVGERKGEGHAIRNGAIFSLAAMVALWGLRAASRQKALGLLGARTYGQETATRLGAFPTVLDPFQWHGVAETGDAYYLTSVDALSAELPEENATMLRKPPPSAALSAAQKTEGARVFLNFSRFPYAVVYDEGSVTYVYIRDLRFASEDSRDWAFVLEVELNRLLQPTRETFSFRIPSPAY